MYEVYFENWAGREVEPDEVFDSMEMAEEYVSSHEQELAYDEGFIIHDVASDRWID